MSELVDEIKRRLTNSSPGDRMYERPMTWGQADVLVAHIEALEAERDRLREVVRQVVERSIVAGGMGVDDDMLEEMARAALSREQVSGERDDEDDDRAGRAWFVLHRHAPFGQE